MSLKDILLKNADTNYEFDPKENKKIVKELVRDKNMQELMSQLSDK